MLDEVQNLNMHDLDTPRRKGRRLFEEIIRKIFEKMMAKNFPKQMKDINSQIQRFSETQAH